MKQPEIIIHIGMHKTGTTSIQRTFARHLNDFDFVYVKLENPNHSREIFTLFEEKNHPSKNGIENQKVEEINRKTKNRLIENFQIHPNKKYIISGESIRSMSPHALINFKSFLDQFFKKITIVAYIRPPKAYMESAFQQVIKGGTNNFDIDKVYPNYRKFKQFFNIFGEDNIRLWKFDVKHFPDNDVVLDFCQRLGIKTIPENIIKDNESISKEALSLLYIYRKFGPGYGNTPTSKKENDHLIQVLSQINGHKVRFGPKLINPILNKYKKDIEWMESILGESLSEDIQPSKYNIEEEKDLLSVSTESLIKLKEIIDEYGFVKNMQPDSMQEIADNVHVLRTQSIKKPLSNFKQILSFLNLKKRF